MAELTKKQISMRAKIRKLFPKKRIGVYLAYSPRNTATINLLGNVDRNSGERIMKRSGLFIEIHYNHLLDNFYVWWE